MTAMPKRDIEEDTDENLIARYLRSHPARGGVAEALVEPYGIPMWALAGAVTLSGATPEEVARDYDIPMQAMSAALAYYRRHREMLDARIAANRVGAV